MIRGASSGLPASGIARNLFAGGDSSPRLSSNGPAILTGIFPSQGHLFAAAISNPKAVGTGPALNWVARDQLIQARRDGWRLGNSADRARLYGGGESADHPGLVSLPGSQSVLKPPVAASLVADPPFRTGEPCRRALSPDPGRGGISHECWSPA